MIGTATLPTANQLSVSPNRSIASTEFRRSARPKVITTTRVCVASVKSFADVQSVTDSRRSAASFYDILRIGHNASPREIKTAYRSLAKLYHPDSLRQSECDSDRRNFIEIHDAYETLSDPATRAHYDLSLAALSRRSYLFSLGNLTRSRPHRRWETDQCW